MDTNIAKKCFSMKMLICIKQHLSNVKTQFMKKLSNTGAGLKKALLIKKRVLGI